MQRLSFLLVLFIGVSLEQCTVPYTADTRTFSGTVRDVWPCNLADPAITCGSSLSAGTPNPICKTNPSQFKCATDFERYNGADLGALSPFLDTTNRIPVLASTGHPSIINASQFAYWYRDDPNFNIPFAINLTASNANTCNSLVYEFNDQNFFPINGRGFGDFFTINGVKLNFAFTYTIHLRFTYQGNEVFNFDGDDDVWVFINDRLAMDMGGVHSTQSATLDLRWPAGGCTATIPNPPPVCSTPGATNPTFPCACILNLTAPGTPYTFDLFYNERHTSRSDLKFSTSLFLQCPYYDFCGVCQGDGQSCCNCQSRGPCYSSKCDRNTGACIYTQKTCPPAPDACTVSYCNNTDGTCQIKPLVCNDSNLCTQDGCNLQVGCTFQTISCDDGNPCTTDTCSTTQGCMNATIPNCNGCTNVVCPIVGDSCTTYQCDPNSVTTPKECKQINKTCSDGNLCTADSCDPATGCVFTPITCNDNNGCTVDTCDSALGCVYTPQNCDDNNNCTVDSCGGGICKHTPIALKPSTRCLGVYCDPVVGVVELKTVCPSACSVCTDDVGCNDCPGGFGTVAQIATGIGGGIIAAIVIGAVAAIIAASVAGKKGYDALMKYRDNMTTATSNPLYESNGLSGENPLHE